MNTFGYKGHLIIGFIVVFTVGHFIPLQEPKILLVALIGSLLPDIDTPKSMLGRIVYLPLGHRGVTHSILGSAILCIPAWIFISKLAFFYMWIGALSHCFSDGEFKII